MPTQPGHLPAPDALVDIPRLITAYYALKPDPSIAAQRVAFGTSGHRGSALHTSFNDAHIAAITQAIVEYRRENQVSGPLFLAKDTHALSDPAFATALEVLAANEATVMVDSSLGYTPTPALSHAILSYNRDRIADLADGIVITPSHNPPEDGGFKYNPPNGGPADTSATRWIENRANELIAAPDGIRRISYAQAINGNETHRHDFLTAYVDDLSNVIDFDPLQNSALKLAVDPLGGAGVYYWPRIIDQYNLNVELLNPHVDPTFRFMTADWDGKIRMDCSSPYAMASVIEKSKAAQYDVAWACDTDHDRHGIVAKSCGLLNPNHFLATAIQYLFTHRAGWAQNVGIGKTLVSSSMIDRVAKGLNRPMLEVPVGFKWFVDGLIDGTLGFVGEESAGASFLRRNGAVWTTDKDGLIMGLLAAEMTVVTGKDPGQLYEELTAKYGSPVYQRIDAAASKEQKAKLGKLSASQVTATELAGDKITAILTEAPGNHAPIGGLKVTTGEGWFAARPSGTEDVYKIYAESFRGEEHLKQIQQEAQALVNAAIA